MLHIMWKFVSLDASVVTASRGVVRGFVGVRFDVFVSDMRMVEAVELFWSGGVFVFGCSVWFVRKGVVCGTHVLPLGDSS
jgi:hypothetical protein